MQGFVPTQSNMEQRQEDDDDDYVKLTEGIGLISPFHLMKHLQI